MPIVALTRGWQGLTLFTRDAVQDVAALPREEVDATGAGDVFAAAFLVRYHECQDVLEAAAFASLRGLLCRGGGRARPESATGPRS